MFGGIGLIISVPWLAYEKLIYEPKLRLENVSAKNTLERKRHSVSIICYNHRPNKEYKDELIKVLERPENHELQTIDYKLAVWLAIMKLHPQSPPLEAIELTGEIKALPAYGRAKIDVTTLESRRIYQSEREFLSDLCELVFADSATPEQKRQILKITDEMGFWKYTNKYFKEWNEEKYLVH